MNVIREIVAKPEGALYIDTATPKIESMHQTRTFMGISKKDNDIFRKF
jgi:hypothetical protein